MKNNMNIVNGRRGGAPKSALLEDFRCRNKKVSFEELIGHVVEFA